MMVAQEPRVCQLSSTNGQRVRTTPQVVIEACHVEGSIGLPLLEQISMKLHPHRHRRCCAGCPHGTSWDLHVSKLYVDSTL